MARFLKSRLKAKGAAPGSFIFLGKQKMDTQIIRLIQFNNETTSEKQYKNIEEALGRIASDKISWLNIDGLHDVAPIKAIGKHFNVSPLAFENILNTGQRSKFIEDKNALIVVAKAVEYNAQTHKILGEQISFILCKNVLITFQEKSGNIFDSVRDRIKNDLGYVRKSPADYLLFTLLDCVVDNNLIIIEQIGANIEQIEHKLTHPDETVSKELYHYRTEISYFRKTVRPLKEVITRILSSNSDLLNKETDEFFRELNDLIDQSIESIETYYQMASDQLTIYNTNVNIKANDIMKVLAIFTSIFIPLNFIVGVYGTNFDYLPELHFKYGYLGMWVVMLSVVGAMLFYFKRNKWF